MAVGDSYNHLSMLEFAGIGVAVANAPCKSPRSCKRLWCASSVSGKMRPHPNIYVDISANVGKATGYGLVLALLAAMKEVVGNVNRVLFASDYPWYPPTLMLELLQQAKDASHILPEALQITIGEGHTMSEPKVLESTLSMNFDESAYENAREIPTLYRAMHLEPRRQHPFWIYDSILKQCRLAGAALETIPPIAEQIAAAFIARGKKRILFSGIGASYHLAASAAHLFGKVTSLPADFIDSSEALLSDLAYDYADCLVVGLSASGNTLEAVEHLHLAREAGALPAAFVNLDHTRLVQESELSFVAPGGYGYLWDYTTRLAPLVYLATELALQMKRPAEPLNRLRDELYRLPSLMEQVVRSTDARCRSIGEALLPLRAAVIPTSGNLLPLAWEMTLRFEEMAHFPARGRPIVDFLHGGVGHLADDIAAILLAAPGKAYPFSQRVAQVTQVLKTPCIAVVEEKDEEIAHLADEVVRLPATHPVLRPLLYLLPAQLIPYYVEVSRPGGNPDILRTDQPRYARAFDVAYPPKSH